MSVNYYDVAEAVVCEATFRDDTGALVAPSTVKFKHEKPNGTETIETVPDADITNPSLGVYRRVLVPAIGEHGLWTWRFESTGPNTAFERKFIVKRTAFQA